MQTAWTIAAHDSSCGAGIQADLAAFAHFNIHGCSATTKITAQNTHGIVGSYTLPGNIFKQQLEALIQDLPPHAIKISVLGSNAQINILAKFLENINFLPQFNKFNNNIIYDPVITSSSHTILTETKLINNIRENLFPLLTLITPNIPEAEILTGIKINSTQDIISAAQSLLSMGVKNVLIKGGHLFKDQQTNYIEQATHVNDLFMNTQQSYWVSSKRQHQQTQLRNIHGTGCHLSSAITANLALNYNIFDSIIIAKRYINAAIRNSYQPNPSSAQYYIPQFDFKVNHLDMPIVIPNLPHINLLSQLHSTNCAKNTQLDNFGLYPIVDNSAWIAKLIEWGVKTIQLRIKDYPSIEYLENEVITSVKLAKQHNIKLFINDHWKLSIKHNAYGVHLGQEDLQSANITEIKRSGLYLGISTHSHHELANALAYQPSYIALGPIYPTNSKAMSYAPQGLERIYEWQNMLTDKCPLVVIGGIGPDNIDTVLSTNSPNIAVISAITKANNPELMTKQLLQKINILLKYT
ncbi:MAG: thiamine phosphate synthase [Pseudomonadota bacterium]|nr:thiamine phosphate synthase [Pseudomonadota bacterium]